MATINSVELYLSRTHNRTGWNIHVDIHEAGTYTTQPDAGDTLGSKIVAVDDVPKHGSQDWVTFTFDTPIDIGDSNFFGIHVWCDTSQYQATGLYWYKSDDWSDATGGEPYAGKERFLQAAYPGGSWTGGDSGAYKVNCTDCDDNSAESPLGTLTAFNATVGYGKGVRTYLDAGGAAPSKPTNPTPSDADTRVDFSGLVLDWDDGGGADTFDVYIGPVGSLVKVASAIEPSTYTVSTDDVPWGETISWKVDATNAGGTTEGDTWSFDVVIIRSVWLGSAGSFLVVAAKDGVYLSTDSGANWSRKTPDSVEDTDWVKGICSDDGTYVIVVSNANAIYRSANSGAAWAEITPADGNTFSVNDLATSDDGQFMVIVGQNSTDATESCYISDDYGATWTAKKPVAASIEWTECDISNDGTVIAVSTTSYFYISLDSGATWLEQGMASTAEVWKGLSISGDGTTGLIANTNDDDEFFIGTYTELYSEATWAESALTSAGRALLDDADAAAQATTLELGTTNSPTWVGATFSGLSASKLVASGGSKGLESVSGTSVHPEFLGVTIKDSEGTIIFYVDDDELYFTASAAIPIEAGMVMGLWLFWGTYAAP